MEIIGQRFGPALHPPVVPARIAHRRDEPRTHVFDSRARLQIRNEHFLDEILGVAVGNAELAAGDEQQQPDADPHFAGLK